MKRTPLNRIGKIGRRNQEANKVNYGRFEALGIDRCELCGGTFGLAVAHKEKREWYRACPELLYDEKQTALLCVNCHDKLDDRSKTSKQESDEIFDTLRA